MTEKVLTEWPVMMLRFCFRVFIVDKSSSGLPTFSLNFGGDKRMSLEMSQEFMARTPPWPPVSYSRRSAICSQTRGLILGGILVQFSVCVLGAAMQCNWCLINNNVCEPGRQAGWWCVIYYYYYDHEVKLLLLLHKILILKRQMHDGGGECTKVSKELFENVVIDILV